MASTTQTTQTAAQAPPARATTTLEFAQAMDDFTTMFPDVDKEVIEAVLRSNQGVVDATIDQLLTMSLDNQNEKLRNGPEPQASSSSAGNIIDLDDDDLTDSGQIRLISSTPLSPVPMDRHTGASPKVKSYAASTSASTSAQHNQHLIIVDVDNSSTHCAMRCDDVLAIEHQPRKWRPALLGPLPNGFLRLSNEGQRAHEFDIPDEQFALMLQNEEFMNELRWNPEFMHALEKEQHLHQQQQQQQQQQQKATDGAASGSGDVAQFRERVRHMGKRSRKKFAMLARVFTWQRHKKPGAVRHPDSLPLREEHSDDDTDAQQQQQKLQRGRGGVPRQ